jgi:hypothetical protein
MSINKNIKTTFSGYITEASVSNDKYYYDIAEVFFDKMFIELKSNNFSNQSGGHILFKGSEISSNFSDLLIIFTSALKKPKFGGGKFNGDGGFGIYKKYRVIVINNLSQDRIPTKGLLKHVFIHEFIHYLDYNRSNGYVKKLTDKTTVEQYYNTPMEVNAYYQEYATYVVNLLDNELVLKDFKQRYKTFDSFYNWMITDVIDSDFVNNLNDKNIKKIKKRIYNIYSKFIQ